ncbi:hypothetical protein BCV72DRAFT_312482 [Rhizopus microsporus var. microsporus]|uniref:EF-hand domain-containing protein n=2 Tax=Rhizopus microsporus TaxID=58291 RepID=A0A2G4T388_RHIZD|nr:uncharacterized protein RHIMIDRAFT_234814 [Rhizopus microsporus ATCC 52813]ORE04606.1 hypothetical protein BCV72DRAFT_312482 [Rhizopus microsporus var. microsporus]PHZ15467.1 hypothetical protein RHIMIDRAFT_234814 [Rhizopus microsporus ATCC 52813]
MPRIPIYPEAEQLIALKSRTRIENIQSNDNSDVLPAQNSKRTDTKRKDTFDVIKAKKDGKRRHQAAISETPSSTNELLQIKLGSNHQRYTVSIPFASFCRETPKKANSLEKIKTISGFIREAILKSQLFVNYFILKHPNKLTNGFFEQNFWHTISRIVRAGPDKIKSILVDYRNRRKERPNEENLDVDQLTNSFVYLSSTTTHGNLFVEENGLRNYEQSLSTACETVATSYNNYYIENFEDIICNYFFYTLKRKYPNVKVGYIKNLVYNHVYDEILIRCEPSSIPDEILGHFDSDVASSLSSFLNPLILEIKNRMLTLPVSKVSLNNGPFKILPVLRHILEKYENLHMAQPSSIDKDNVSKFVYPRLFSLFPNPGLGWRFIKVDAQNLTGIFPEAKQEKQINESPFNHNQRQFFQMFDFKKLGFRSWEELKNMLEQRGRMFLNGMYTDGYMCRMLFCRKVLPAPATDDVSLEVSDFTTDKVEKYFRPYTVDQGRKDAFVSYYRGTDVRRLSSAEYYGMGGKIKRQKLQQERKKSLGIERIEANMSSSKTASLQRYMSYINYMLQHMDILLNFYNFEAAKLKG